MIETNPFRFFIPSHPEKLIVGSFPCLKQNGYGDWFYSGSGRNHFWSLLSDVLGMPAGNRAEKTALCEKYGIALTDIAYRITRSSNNCSDANLKIITFNREGIDACLDTGLQQVIFTSRFVEKHFNRLYPGHSLSTKLLLSPSPAANMHIGGLEEYKRLRATGRIGSPYEYRLLKYRELLA